MKNKYFFLLLLLVCFAQKIIAQQLNLNGQVLSNNRPVGYALVQIKELNLTTQTDSNGFFVFEKLTKDSFLLSVKLNGFFQEKVRVNAIKYQNKPLIIELTENETILNDVVISGTLKEITKKESTISVEVISPKLFQQNPTSNIFESIGMVNGIRPQLNCNVCNTGDIRINGMEGPYTMVMIDGMPIVSALSSVYGFMGIPNSIIERVEVQRGPASTLYGSEAVGGLINIITKSTKKAPKLSFDVSSTSYFENNFDFSSKIKITPKVQTLFSTNVFYFDQIWDKNNDGFTDLAIQKRISLFSKTSFERGGNKAANIAARLFYENRWGGQTNWTEKFRSGDSIYGESIFTKRLELIGNYQLPYFTEKVVLSSSFNIHDQNSAYGNVNFLAQQIIGFNQLTFDKLIAKKHNLLIGAALRISYYDDNTIVTANQDSSNKPNLVYMPGIFIQDDFRINIKNKILLGVRYDLNAIHGHIFSPRFNYKYAPNSSNAFRFSIGNGFRVVNLFSEEHAALTGARQVVILNDLKPEQSWNVSFNFIRNTSLQKSLINLDFNLFYTYFSNRIVPDFLTNSNQVIFNNINGYAINRGINFSADATINKNLETNIGFTLVDVFVLNKDSLNREIKNRQIQTPPLTFNYGINYNLKKYNFKVDLTGTLTSPMLLPVLENDFRPSESPWFALVNVQFSKLFHNNFSIYGGIKNLLNFVPKNPIMRPFDPFDKQINVNNPNQYTFDPSYNYAPLQGIRAFLGIRYLLN